MNRKRGQHDDQDEDVHRHLARQVEHPEQAAARHALDAVLAAGEFRLQSEEIHHLRQGQGDHGEIDALAADGEAADNDAEHGGGRGADEDREFGRQHPHLGGVRGEIARPAEEHGMAERDQADIADQKVEGAGEQRETQRLHEKDRIGDEWRDDEQHHHHDEGRTEAPARLLAPDQQGGIERLLHHAFRPNRPAGRISSTIAMMTKITVLDASG